MQRQWAQITLSLRKPRSARYSVGSRLRCACTAATSPQIWLRWMVIQVPSFFCSALRSLSSSGEHMSGAQAEMAMRMRPSALPFHLAKVFSIVAMCFSPIARSSWKGAGSPIAVPVRS